MIGVEASLVDVEIDVSGGLPAFAVVGLPDSTVRESRDRVRSAIRHAGFEFPERRITVNLAPADVRKSGASYDLPIALGLLAATDVLPPRLMEDLVVVGALSLDGGVQPVRGVLPVAILAARHGHRLVLPAANLREGSIVEQAALRPAASLAQIVADLVNGAETSAPVQDRPPSRPAPVALDLADVRGQRSARRALEIAAAGRHNLLLVRPSRRRQDAARQTPCRASCRRRCSTRRVASTAIHSVAGLLEPAAGLLAERPFRAPHHSASEAALIGGGRDPRPGEVSLAHNGVLFLDEIVEFERRTLEALREPLEDGTVRIARALRTVQFPARFLLVGAMNPCACGYAGESLDRCRCSQTDIRRYHDRLSGPLRDRIDLTVRVERVPFEVLAGDVPAEDTDAVRERVRLARDRQRTRYRDEICTNADLSGLRLRRHGRLDEESLALIERAVRRLGLTGRGFDRIRRVARTIADLDDSPSIRRSHVAEAIQYRVIH